MPNPARRLAVTLAFDLAMFLFASGCGGAQRAEASPAPMMDARAAEAPAPPPPPAAPGGAAGAGYAPAPAPGDMAASYAPQPAPPPAAAPASPSRGPSAGAKVSTATAKPPAAAAAKAPPPPPAKAPPPPPGKAAPPPGKPGEPGSPQTAAQAPSVPVAPLLIYVGDIQMMVPEEAAIPVTIDKVIDLAESLGGYLAGRKDTSVQVRIPSMRFRDGFTMIEKLGDVTHRSVSADDVSEQYSDLEVRLQNLRATQKRLHEFLAKAGNVQDMLTVGRELDRVAGEIEAIEGKMRFLRSRAAFSLVTVGFQVKPKVAVVVASKNEPPPPRQISLPIGWLPRVGLDTLLNLH